MPDNGLFMRMCRDAMDEIATGDKGWKEVDTNTLLMAAFGMLFNHLISKLVRPLYFLAGSVATAVIGYLIKLYLS